MVIDIGEVYYESKEVLLFFFIYRCVIVMNLILIGFLS